MNAPSNEDFRRLEEKVDKLTDAVMRLVLIEERQSNMGVRIGVVEQKMYALEQSIQTVDKRLDQWVNRGMGAWAIVVLCWTAVQFLIK